MLRLDMSWVGTSPRDSRRRYSRTQRPNERSRSFDDMIVLRAALSPQSRLGTLRRILVGPKTESLDKVAETVPRYIPLQTASLTKKIACSLPRPKHCCH